MAGLDVDELQNVTKGGQLAAMSAASLKVELVARLLAEGVKEIFQKIHGALIRHHEGPIQFELSGKWVEVDPSQWRRRSKINVNVGLGSGNREEQRVNIQVLAQAQGALAQMGLVGPKQAYQSFKSLCEALGYNQPEMYAMDPDSPEYQQHMQQMAQQPPPPNPMAQVAQIKAQSAEKIETMRMQVEQSRAQAEAASDKADLEHAALDTHATLVTDRESNKKDYDLAILKALAQIISQQIKGQQENAGQLLEQDFQAAQGIEQRGHEVGMTQMSQQEPEAPAEPQAPQVDPNQERMMQLMEGLTGALQQLGKPRTATLSDGRKITIQ